MAFCTQCGKKLSSDDSFCTGCGKPVFKNQQCNDDSRGSSGGNGGTEPSRTDAKKVRLTILCFVGALIVVALSLMGLNQPHEKEISKAYAPETNYVSKTPQQHAIRFELSGKENFLFSRYDTTVSFDGETLGSLPHGGFVAFERTVDSGKHTLEIAKSDDADVSGSIDIYVNSDLNDKIYQVSCYSGRVAIDEMGFEEANERRAKEFLSIANNPGENAWNVVKKLEDAGYEADGFELRCLHGESDVDEGELENTEYAVLSAETDASDRSITLQLKSPEEVLSEELLSIANQSGQSAEMVIGQLEEKGFENAGYVLKCFEGEEEITDFIQSDYEVVSGSIDSDAKIITLTLRSTKPVEVSFDQETAKRAAVVAMSNCYAPDVYDESGDYYDSSKFRSYADISSHYMTVENEGSWTAVDENTWHVDKLTLKVAGGTFHVCMTGDVSFDGTNYVLSGVTVGRGNSKWAAESGHDYETFEPSDFNVFLTVPPSLIAEDRDMEAERSATEAENAARDEEEEYDSWVSSHFSFWDGSCNELEDLIKERLNDESSYRHKNTTYIAAENEERLEQVNGALSQAGLSLANLKDVVVTVEFTAKNGFNATIKNSALGIIRYPSGTVELLSVG